MKKRRLDEFLIEQKLVRDKPDAFVKVTEGAVFLNGHKAISPAQMVGEKDKIEFRGRFKYVGRGALKLEAALKNFEINPTGKICADIGSATGGFTEILLLHEAEKVYAIDTARGKMAPKIRENPKVVVMEDTDVRSLDSPPHQTEINKNSRETRSPLWCGGKLPEEVDLVTIDVSLIPLENILPAVRRFLSPKGEVVALFKPQYQTRDQSLLHHGIIKTDQDRENLLEGFKKWAESNGWKIKNTMESPIRGDKGNKEYLIHMSPKN